MLANRRYHQDVALLSRIFVYAILLHIVVTVSSQSANYIVPDDYPTIQQAIDAASPGDTVIVKSGIYLESLTISKHIILTADNYDSTDPTRNSTIIDANGDSAAILISGGVSPMPEIRGFTVRNFDDGVVLSSEAVIEDNYFHSGNDLIDAEAGGGGFIRNNVFFEAADDAVDLDDSTRPLVIEHNRIYSSHDDGIEIRLQPDSAPSANIEIIIRNNEIVGNGRDGIQFIDYVNDPQNTNRTFTITRNLFANNGLAAIGLMPDEETREDLSGADIVESVNVYNNTFYGNSYALSGGDNLVAFNNIIVNSQVGVSRVQGESGDNSVLAYSLLYQNAQNIIDSTLGVGNILDQDPYFEYLPQSGFDGLWNTLDDDFSGLVLLPNSPATDAGVTYYLTARGELVPDTPIDFQGQAPDLGWQESHPPQSSPIPTSPVAPSTLTSIYYIDCDEGNDANSGMSEGDAWRSLTKASSVSLNRGDRILLRRDCIWSGETLVISSSGTPEQKIVVSSYGSGATPHISNNKTNTDGVRIAGSYIIVENIHTSADPPAIEKNCDNNAVGHIVGFSIESTAHDVTIQYSMAEGLYAGMSISPGAHNNRIINNLLFDNTMMNPLDNEPDNDSGGFGILVRGDDNEIAYNRISGNDSCSYDYGRDGAAIELYSGQRNLIHHNIVQNSNAFTELGNSSTADNVYAYNLFTSSLDESTFMSTRGADSARGPVLRTTLYNNTVYMTGSRSQGFVCSSGCTVDILTMHNNIFHVAWRIGFSDGPMNESHNLFWGGELLGVTPNSNSYIADPLFFSTLGDDFHLQQTSPAINAAIPMEISFDLDINLVPIGSARDIGAYEFVLPPSPVGK